MSTIHREYAERAQLVAFSGTRDELQPGAYLGTTARPELMRRGDFITAVSGYPTHYFYDPDLLIAGESYVKVGTPARTWQYVHRTKVAR